MDIAKSEAPLAALQQGRSVAVGLHTCGNLANSQLFAASKAECPIVLNFSCCYYKMSGKDYFISNYGKRCQLRLTPEARTLAGRSSRKSRDAYDLSKRVKRYRYLIHLFFYHEMGIRKFRALGNSPRSLYRGDFVEYGLEQLRRIGRADNSVMARKLQSFYGEEKYREIVHQMILANIIRSVAARPLELLLLLDRAIYMEEQGYQVTLAEYFDEVLSPRNIGILAANENFRF